MIFYFFFNGKFFRNTTWRPKNNIKTFIANQKDNIIKIFEDESYEKQNIEYSINEMDFRKKKII